MFLVHVDVAPILSTRRSAFVETSGRPAPCHAPAMRARKHAEQSRAAGTLYRRGCGMYLRNILCLIRKSSRHTSRRNGTAPHDTGNTPGASSLQEEVTEHAGVVFPLPQRRSALVLSRQEA